MRNEHRIVAAGLCAIGLVASATASAQSPEVREKPAMYTYESFWTIPRAQWGEMAKGAPSSQAILGRAIAAGTLVGHGDDAYVVHDADGATHDSWWSAMTMAGVLNVLDEVQRAGGSAWAVLASSTKHWDSLFLSHYYNWRSGSWKGAYTMWSGYRLKATAPDDAVGVLARDFAVPQLEKLLADGTIVEYEIDVPVVQSDDSGIIAMSFISPNAEGLEKASTALREAIRKAALDNMELGAVVDFSKHRDALARTNVTYR